MVRNASFPEMKPDLRTTGPITHVAQRGSESFYADSAHMNASERRCRGLSCSLVPQEQTEVANEQAVYCLGYCDQSPVSLSPEGVIRAGAGAGPPRVSAIRCAARTPVVTERLVAGDYADLHAAQSAGVYSALQAWVKNKTPVDLLDTVSRSGELGRGGAGFPTGEKWRACAEASGARKVVIANGDEGDPGSYIDRLLLERDPHAVIEGLALCAFAVGASHGLIYVRSEYPHAYTCISQAVADATAAGIIGAVVADSPFSFTVEVVSGHGSYVCGEESALLNSIEGQRGEVRLRPPYPTEQGLFGLPTVVNNVETLVNIPWIARQGASAYRELGTAEAQGTKVMCLNHGFASPGAVEVELGTPLRQVIEEYAGGGAAGKTIEAVALGGPMGSVLTADQWDVPVGYRTMHEAGVELGHGGLVALPVGTDYRSILRHWLEFMAAESCGRCVACRSGSREALALAEYPEQSRAELEALLGVIAVGSLCAFGRNIPRPVRQLLALID